MDEHGKATFRWQNNILYTEAFGPFNEQGVRKAAMQYLYEIENRHLTPYSVIEIWDEYSLACPEGMKKVEQLWALLSYNQCSAFALVAYNATQASIASKLLPPIGKVFQNIEEAEQWIADRMAAL
jgi:hypothetical protein